MENEQEIEQSQWAAFAEEFTRHHAGETASLESLSSDAGDQLAAENLPFVGLTLETKGSAAGTFSLSLGTEENSHMDRTISGPRSLRLHQNAQTGATTLKVEAEDDEVLLLHLQPMTALPAP